MIIVERKICFVFHSFPPSSPLKCVRFLAEKSDRCFSLFVLFLVFRTLIAIRWQSFRCRFLCSSPKFFSAVSSLTPLETFPSSRPPPHQNGFSRLKLEMQPPSHPRGYPFISAVVVRPPIMPHHNLVPLL